MHTSALARAQQFFDQYRPQLVLEVGSLEVCGGGMRDVVNPQCVQYIGVDMVAGPGVDAVLADPYRLPYDNTFDAVVSTSTFEHSEFFWLVFVEMVRAAKPGGLIYVNAPSNGPFHRHPVDCWRFYADAGQALARWAERSGLQVEVVETGISPPDMPEDGIGSPDDRGPDGYAAWWRDWWCVWRRIA